MSIFDRFRDIANFLNTRPESRTQEQEKVGEELEGAAKTTQEIAESRLQGTSDEEARGLADLVRDFFSSDDKGIKKFREKNKDQIAADKKFVNSILKKTPAGAVKDFVVKQVIQRYGPQVAELSTDFFNQITEPETPKAGGQFDFMGTIYTDQDYFDAGKITRDEGGLYKIDQGRGGVSNIKAFINLLPDDYSKLPTQVYNDFRQVKKNYPNTPFADFYDPSSLKTSGLEYNLLVANQERPDLPITKANLLELIVEGGDLDSSVTKTRYNRGESGSTEISATQKRVQEAIDQLAGYSANQYVGKYFPELNQYLLDVRDALVTEQDKLRAGTREDFSETEKQQYSEALSLEFGNRLNKVIESLKTERPGFVDPLVTTLNFDNLPGSEARNAIIEKARVTAETNYFNVIDQLVSGLNNNVRSALAPPADDGVTPTGDRMPTYSNMAVMGTGNYDVQGVTVKEREALSERLNTGSHYSGDYKGPNRVDSFHFRTGQLNGDAGPINYLIEVQSDLEESIRKTNKSYDPSEGIKLYNLAEKNIKYAAEKLPEIENFYKITEGEKEQLNTIQNFMRYDPDSSRTIFAYQSLEDPTNVYVRAGPLGSFRNANGEFIDDVELNERDFKVYRNSPDQEFIPAGSEVMKTFLEVYFGDDNAVMTDRIPAANLNNYLAKNDRNDELLKYMKKLNVFREDIYKQDKIGRENQEGAYSKTVPYSTSPQAYAEKAVYEFINDSVRQGVDKVSWVPGEVSTQIQFARESNPSDFADHDTTLSTHHSNTQSRGMFDFYGSSKQTKDNHMYRAAEVVVDKISKIGTRIYGEDFVAPKVYEQGAKNEAGQFINPIDATYFTNNNNEYNRGEVMPGITQGWGFIDLKPMLDSIKGENKNEIVQQILGNYVERKRGGQIESPSLLSLDEVING